MPWAIELSSEVTTWYDSLSVRGLAEADEALDRLERQGNEFRMPHSRALGHGLHELRFNCEKKATRITYIFDAERSIITLTTFHKQRDNEQRQIQRARRQARRALNQRRNPS